MDRISLTERCFSFRNPPTHRFTGETRHVTGPRLTNRQSVLCFYGIMWRRSFKTHYYRTNAFIYSELHTHTHTTHTHHTHSHTHTHTHTHHTHSHTHTPTHTHHTHTHTPHPHQTHARTARTTHTHTTHTPTHTHTHARTHNRSQYAAITPTLSMSTDTIESLL